MSNPVEIVVPVLNERDSIAEFHSRVDRIGLAPSLIFVDNASNDGTPEIIEHLPHARLIRHDTDLGYGASIRDGLAVTTAAKVVIIDADLEYPPEAIPDLAAALDRHPVIYGSRFLSAPPPDMPLLRRLGNSAVTRAFDLLFHQSTTDLYTGAKALRREAVARLSLRRSGFEHVVEIGAQLAAAGFRIHDLPVAYSPRRRGVSKMRHIPEFLKCIWLIARYRLGLMALPEAR